MSADERDFRINGRDWDALSEDRIIEILDDTGRDSPCDGYCAAEVYALAREVIQHRAMNRVANAVKASKR